MVGAGGLLKGGLRPGGGAAAEPVDELGGTLGGWGSDGVRWPVASDPWSHGVMDGSLVVEACWPGDTRVTFTGSDGTEDHRAGMSPINVGRFEPQGKKDMGKMFTFTFLE